MMANCQRFLGALALLAGATTGCDKTQKDLEAMIEASAPPASATPSSTVAAPAKPPRIYVTPDAVIVGEQRFDPKDPASAALATNAVSGAPMVALSSVQVDADRKAKLSSVYVVLAGLRRGNAASAEVHTTSRDDKEATVVFSFPKSAPDCSAVASIAKDASISVWTVGGGGAKRFTHGFGGPDMTLGTEAARKAAAGCDSPVWFVGAEDSTPWGLVFDLAQIAMQGNDGGTTGMKPTQVAVLTAEPVPGRKVTLP